MPERTNLEIAHIVEYGEAESFVDMFAAAPPELGCRVERIGSAIMLIAPTLPITLFNRVLCLGVDQPATESAVVDALQIYQKAGLPIHAMQIAPIAQPPTLPTWLTQHGYRQTDNWVKMIRTPDLAISVPTSLRVEQITPEHALDFARVAAASFGMPPNIIPWMVALVGRPGWQHFVGYDGDSPVAAGAIYIHNRIGWLGIGGTLPSHRKRGAQGAIMAHRIRAAAEAGCQWVVTETGDDHPKYPNPSYHNMLRTGFELAYRRRNHIFGTNA